MQYRGSSGARPRHAHLEGHEVQHRNALVQERGAQRRPITVGNEGRLLAQHLSSFCMDVVAVVVAGDRLTPVDVVIAKRPVGGAL